MHCVGGQQLASVLFVAVRPNNPVFVINFFITCKCYYCLQNGFMKAYTPSLPSAFIDSFQCMDTDSGQLPTIVPFKRKVYLFKITSAYKGLGELPLGI